jgi:hypothetical protein
MLCGDSRFYFLYGSGASTRTFHTDDLPVRPYGDLRAGIWTAPVQ